MQEVLSNPDYADICQGEDPVQLAVLLAEFKQASHFCSVARHVKMYHISVLYAIYMYGL